MKRLFLKLSALLKIVFLFILVSCQHNQITIGYVTPDDYVAEEDIRILNWLQAKTHFQIEHVTLNNLAQQKRRLDIYWIHIPDSQAYMRWEEKHFRQIREWYDNGANLLCTNFGALIPAECGIESNKPAIKILNVKDYWNFDKRGFQSWMGHPIFSGLFGGAFVWDLNEDRKLTRIGYFNDQFPAEGKVVAVEKSYITVHGRNRLITEYQTDGSHLLTVGAMVNFDPQNRLRYKLEKFIENTLLYLSGRLKGERTYWEFSACLAKQFNAKSKDRLHVGHRTLQNLPESGLKFVRKKASANFFDLAGRRALVMGKEKGGIDEVWVHPFRIARDFQMGLITKNEVIWLSDFAPKIEIRPESMTRIYETPYGKIKETIFASLEKPGAIIHLTASGDRDVQILIKLRSDLRWMWPYDENALGDVFYGYDQAQGILQVKDRTGRFFCLFGADVKPEEYCNGAFSDILFQKNQLQGIKGDLNQVYHAAIYKLNAGNHFSMNYFLIGTDQGRAEAIQTYRDFYQNPRAEYAKMVEHYQKLLQNYVIIESPDSEFNRLWKWALVGTDRFYTHTPRLGKALVAGFGTADRGWDGGHKNSGRPGYAWYFGRDAAWASFAIDNYGDFELVKNQLQFFQKYQDLSGKIFHEVSTSGVVHYDAADATPLYVILAAHYLKASGDLTFIQQSWSHIKRAIDFLYSTDTDGDMLIENKNVGHGWVEGGKLWGANPTFYLAGLWAQTLKDAAYLAKKLKLQDLSRRYAADAEKVIRILNRDFWNEKDDFFYYGKIKSCQYNPEKTVLPAVVMYYDLLDESKVKNMLSCYASNDFSTDWGIRIISSSSPLFDPRGYHYGSVWPLFTGWAALAEYEYGNSVQGFRHLMNNMNIKKHWALGFVEEVMNGLTYEPAGVCPHQCWSETNVIAPAIHGMVGWRPNAPEKRADLKPRFPLHWNKVKVQNLRIGNSVVELQMERQKNQTRFELRLAQGEPVEIWLTPEIPAGMIIDRVALNHQEVALDTTLHRMLLKPVNFLLTNETEIILNHHNGIGIIPYLPKPRPGDTSQGYRVVNAVLKNKAYFIDLEGKAGSTGTFALKIFDQSIKSIDGAQIENINNDGMVTIKVSFEKSSKEFVRKRVVIRL
ncbi:Amylo-alpha-16-glucosidase [Caldithrix abyssi DSM 13497]|uniref:Amylo-alpha-16-glucosidase n=1 Tax=Caldithrix abyssi DSM 13497 TaxID=880073 RepID=H1XWZ9_CALAY|nr:amylo-alpha-1,6-glucosidase [Caldithrix abyssi]APF19554.1 Protein of unknown function, DUF608 [Caldithrix abyssi DSM 13497]EHO39686.1 Amylo-alpha-16-glucosidase [Caldithrix abyssi DSM 13497]